MKLNVDLRKVKSNDGDRWYLFQEIKTFENSPFICENQVNASAIIWFKKVGRVIRLHNEKFDVYVDKALSITVSLRSPIFQG